MKLLHLLLLILILFLIRWTNAQSIIPDNAFSKKGKFYFSNGRYNEVKNVVIAPNESIFVLVESRVTDSIRDTDIILLKLTSKGIPDVKFGKNGIAQFDFYGMDISRAGEMKLLSDGKILIAGDGTANDYPNVNLSCLIKILPNGSPDLSFGKSGTVSISFDKMSYLSSLAITNDQSLFVAGSYIQPVGNHEDIFPVVGKVNKSGMADSSFGRSGKIWVDFNFKIFSFASTKHTAGGDITDMIIQEDGRILICGGFIFRYSYEGFIARILPNGMLDKSFNSTGYIRYDFTPGKFNMVKRILLYDSNTLLVGASSQTDFDSDFYFGILNLTTFDFNVVNIDFNGQHDMLEDISLDGKEVILSGRSVLPQNAPLRYQSDFIAIARILDIKNLKSKEIFVHSLSKTNQNGSSAHAVSKDKIVVGGFQLTSNVFTRDVVIARFIKKKIN